MKSLAATRTDEQLGQSVHAVFSQFGPVWIKIRRDQKGMPFAFAQYEVCTLMHNQVGLIPIRTSTLPMPSVL